MYVRTVGIAGRFKRKAGMVMKEVYFTITGMNHYLGSDFRKNGMKVKLIKETDNAYDAEAIKVMMKGVGHCGYVAKSTYTVKGESWSAGRLYDHIGKKAKGTVKLVLPDAVICKLDKKS